MSRNLMYANRQRIEENLNGMAKGAPCKEAQLKKNGETCKNLQWVFQIFKLECQKWRIRVAILTRN